jgi:ribosome biogenesis protein BRX1
MGELGFGGNCLKGGRGVVVFDKSFEDGFEKGAEFRPLVRELLAGVFCVPAKGVRGMKPFIDRIIGVFGLDGKIWIRVYEIRESEKKQGESAKDASDVSLVEIGPRFVLTPIVVVEGSFSGPVLFENKEFVSSNQLRSEARVRRAGKYARRRGEAEERVVKKGSLGLTNSKKEKTELDNSLLFG